MALAHYTATTVSSGANSRVIVNGSSSETVYVSELFTVPSGGEMLVMGTRINGGATGGELHIVNVDSASQIKNNMVFSVEANDLISLDSKECYTAGEGLEIYATQPGITVDIFAHSSTVS